MFRLTFFAYFLFLAIFSLFTGGCSEDGPVTPGEHFSPHGILFRDATKAVYMKIFEGQPDPGKYTEFAAPLGNISDAFAVSFLDAEGKEIAGPGNKTLAFTIDDTSIVKIWQHEGEEGGYEFHLRGLKEGETSIEFKVLHNDHSDYRSGKIKVRVEAGPDKEIVLLRIVDEETQAQLAETGAAESEGSLAVTKGEETDHLEIVFIGDAGEELSPDAGRYSVEIVSSDESVVKITGRSAEEPFAFRLRGENAGTVTISLTLVIETDGDRIPLKLFAPVTVTVE